MITCTTGALSRNVGKLFSKLKLVTDNLFLRPNQTPFSEGRLSSGLHKCLQIAIYCSRTIVAVIQILPIAIYVPLL